MPSFTYRVATTEGRTFQGVEEAASATALERLLAGRGLYTLEVAPSRTTDRQGRRGRGIVGRGADVAESMATLAVLLEAALPLDSALEITARGAAREDVAAALTDARAQVREGGHLADALADRPRLFPAIAVGLLRAGERGGHLAQAVHRLAEHMERQRALRGRLLSAMIYPLLLVGVGAIALVVLLLFVLPRFTELLRDTGATLPRATQLLLDMVSFFERGWPTLIASTLGLVLAFVGWRRTEAGRERIDALLLRTPVVGALRARYAAARLARTLATLLSSGLPLLPALEIASAATGDAAVSVEIRGAREAVRRGEALSVALRRSGIFPYLFVRLVEVGEESGRLEALLERSAAMLETELERRLERLVSLLEPTLILLFGAAVGFVALALLQAVYGIHADAF